VQDNGGILRGLSEIGVLFLTHQDSWHSNPKTACVFTPKHYTVLAVCAVGRKPTTGPNSDGIT